MFRHQKATQLVQYAITIFPSSNAFSSFYYEKKKTLSYINQPISRVINI